MKRFPVAPVIFIVWAVIVLGLLSSCSVMEDARRGAEDGFKAAIKDLPPPVKPIDAEGYGIIGTASALLAYVLGSAGKGWIRGKIGHARKDS